MSMRVNPRVERVARFVSALLIAVAAVVAVSLPGSVALAHTAFSGSTPSDADVLDAPVSLVTLVFTGDSEETGDGFLALDPSGQVRTPTSVATLDNKVFTLTFDPPLAGGEIGIRWSVRAPDTHPIEGAFSFTVTASAPAASAALPASASTESASETATTLADSEATASMTAEEMAAMGSEDMSSMSDEEMASMDDFLAVDNSRPGDSQATIGRLLSFVGIALALGGVAFAATTLRGELIEIGWLLSGVKVTGIVLAIGAIIEYGGVVRIAGDSFAGYWTSSPGFATVLRLTAGLAIAAGFAASTVALRPARRTAPASLSAGVLIEQSEIAQVSSEAVHRWVPDRSSMLGFAGCGLALISFWFDGHTVSKGFRPLHDLANTVHVFAGSVWVGGVVAMAAILWSRRQRNVRPKALQMMLQFSAIATIALGAVVVAGLVMAVFVLDSFGALTGTEWGQVLLLKTAAVGLAAVGGAYNHFTLVPALEADPSNRALHDQVRSIVTAEAIMLVFVVVVTAWLVSAASS